MLFIFYANCDNVEKQNVHDMLHISYCIFSVLLPSQFCLVFVVFVICCQLYPGCGNKWTSTTHSHLYLLKIENTSWYRFDALNFLGRMRRKRIMLVGDSIMRNQWESLVCLVQGVIPTGRKRVTYSGPSMAFHAMVILYIKMITFLNLFIIIALQLYVTLVYNIQIQDFETSIEFSWAPLLVELKKGPQNKRILHLDLIEDNAKYWRGVDILVFDSAHWWTHSDQWSS